MLSLSFLLPPSQPLLGRHFVSMVTLQQAEGCSMCVGGSRSEGHGVGGWRFVPAYVARALRVRMFNVCWCLRVVCVYSGGGCSSGEHHWAEEEENKNR